MNKKFLVKIREREIFLTPTLSFSLVQTNFPPTVKFAQRNIFYEVEQFSNNNVSVLELTISDYNPFDIYKFNNQTFDQYPKRINFFGLTKRYIMRDLMTYSGNLWKDKKLFIQEPEEMEINFSRFPTYEKQPIPFPHKAVINEENFTWEIKYKNCVFENGKVSFLHKEVGWKESRKFTIENKYIIPQFDNIKTFFPKAFGGKRTFTVHATLVYTDFELTDTKATSEDIERINENFVEQLRIDSVRRLISRAAIQNSNKTIFTAEEIFEEGNIFKQSEANIIEILSKGIRNRKQLEYLSGYKHSAKQKIRFTLKPHFGFLFFIEGKEKYHFCWELLESHATYLWNFKKEQELNLLYQEIEHEISIIHQSGREEYIRIYREDRLKKNFLFTRVAHQDINSIKDDGFILWKETINYCTI